MTCTTKSATSDLAIVALFFLFLFLAAEVSGNERKDDEAGKKTLDLNQANLGVVFFVGA